MLSIIKSIPIRFFRPRLRDPRIRSFLNPPISPCPGLNLKAPEDWTVEKYFKKIGGDLSEYIDKFSTVQEVLNAHRFELKGKGIPARKRKYIMMVNEYFRRGFLSFEHIDERTATPKKEWVKKAKEVKTPAKKAKPDDKGDKAKKEPAKK